jgi:hypothetical protein
MRRKEEHGNERPRKQKHEVSLTLVAERLNYILIRWNMMRVQVLVAFIS